jgi:hypothetical protein
MAGIRTADARGNAGPEARLTAAISEASLNHSSRTDSLNWQLAESRPGKGLRLHT